MRHMIGCLCNSLLSLTHAAVKLVRFLDLLDLHICSGDFPLQEQERNAQYDHNYLESVAFEALHAYKLWHQ